MAVSFEPITKHIRKGIEPWVNYPLLFAIDIPTATAAVLALQDLEGVTHHAISENGWLYATALGLAIRYHYLKYRKRSRA